MAASKHWVRRGPARASMLALAVAACLALGAAVAGAGASLAPKQLAAVPEGFDDYTPPGTTERLPTDPVRPTYRQILGTWCSPTSTYVIERTKLTVILPGGGDGSTYRVTGFQFSDTSAVVRWVSGENKDVRTTFGRFSADGKTMVQLAANRTYTRCVIKKNGALTYTHILGSWCDVDSKYIITRAQLTVIFSGGRRVTYKITDFKFEKDVIEMYWVDGTGKRSRTRFGRYTSDRRGMTQLGANRAYRRC